MVNKNEIVVLNDDDKQVALKKLKDMNFAVGKIHQLINEERLTVDLKENLGQLMEYYLADVSKIVKFDSLSAEKIEEKHAEVRKANETIRELKEQIARNNPIEGLQEQLKSLCNLFKKWWDKDGFNYVRDMRFTQYGRFEAELGISFSRHGFLSRTPVSDRISQADWEQSLIEKGYKIYKKPESSDKKLIDCPENRALLIQLVTERFPDAVIEKVEPLLIYEAPGHVFEIHSITVVISDYTELKALESYLETKSK